MNMLQIEQLTQQYAQDHQVLSDCVLALQTVIEEAKREAMPEIRAAVRRAAESRDQLHAAISVSPELFAKPRTRVISGIRIGIKKLKGKVVLDDEEKVIERIHAQLPKDQAELLIRVRESVDKNAVADLTVGDLKRLGIRITEDCDEIVIQPTDSEVDKLVSALLGDAEPVEAEAA